MWTCARELEVQTEIGALFPLVYITMIFDHYYSVGKRDISRFATSIVRVTFIFKTCSQLSLLLTVIPQSYCGLPFPQEIVF